MMGLGTSWREMTLPEWSSTSLAWSKVNGGQTVRPPSEDEFERAVLAARGITTH